MAGVSFIADWTDIIQSTKQVCCEMNVVFIENRRFDCPRDNAVRDFISYGKELMSLGGRQFFVLPGTQRLEFEQVEPGPQQWRFAYQGTTGWIQLVPGGWIEKKTLWLPGFIGSNNKTPEEKEMFSMFKKLWLKGYRKGSHGYLFGPSASNSLADARISTTHH